MQTFWDKIKCKIPRAFTTSRSASKTKRRITPNGRLEVKGVRIKEWWISSCGKSDQIIIKSGVYLERPKLGLHGMWVIDFGEPWADLKGIRPAAILQGSWSWASGTHLATDQERHAVSSKIQRKQTRFPNRREKWKVTRTFAMAANGWQQHWFSPDTLPCAPGWETSGVSLFNIG